MNCRSRFLLMLVLLRSAIINSTITPPYEAVTSVPVADLVGHPLHSCLSLYSYETIPVYSKTVAGTPACPRMHQLLFNEKVTVLKETATEVCVAIHSVYFTTQQRPSPQKTYWTEKKNIIPLHKIADASAYLPEALDFATKKITSSQPTVTLIMPWFDPISNQTFSAGTRFVLAHHKEHTYYVYLLDPVTCTFNQLPIDASICLLEKAHTCPQEKRAHFVAVLKHWAHLENGFIPYVWGGASFTLPYTAPHVCERSSHKQHTSFYYPKDTLVPKAGLDCTGLIARAAQLCSIPYFLKNSHTIATTLQPIKPSMSLQEGDIIWIQGHVMVVSDLANNKLIEARGYPDGYGKIHEIELEKVFKGIPTYQNLIKKYHEGTKIGRLNCNPTKKTIEWFNKVMLFSLESCV